MKRLISLLMVLALFLTMLPVTTPVRAATYDGFTYEINNGEATITGYTDGYMFYMVIPQTIEGYPVVSIGAQAFQNRSDLISVDIPEGVRTIEPYAFYQCYNLQEVTLPDSLLTIEDQAFCSCKNLITIDFGDQLKSIGYGAFSFCGNLDFFLRLPDSIEVIEGAAFYDCDTLETVFLPDHLKELGSKALAQCSRLTYVWFKDGITKIGSQVLYQSACYYDSNLWYEDVFYGYSDFALEAKTTISGELTLPLGIVGIADGAFNNCSKLTGITIQDGVKHIGSTAFHGCSSLQRVTIPSTVTTIGDQAFYHCKALEDIQYSAFSAVLGQDVFTGTAYYNDAENWQNNALYLDDLLVECNTSASGVFEVQQGTRCILDNAMQNVTKVTQIILPDTLTTIGDKAFYNCTGLKAIHLGKSVTKIGNGAFGQCSKLESITVDPDNPIYRSQDNCLIQGETLVFGCKASIIPQDGSVHTIGDQAFEGCAGLTEVTIPDTILTIGNRAFQNCDKLTTVNLGNGVQVVGERAFAECDILSQLDLGQSVHTIADRGFAYNHQLTHVEFPASLRYLGEEAFSNSTGLVSVIFHNGIESIGKNCFTFCESLTSLSLPDSLKEIKDGAFYSCEKIATVNLGKGLTTIGSSAFDGCTSLVTLEIPDSVETIGSSAFYECTRLQEVQLGEKVKTIGYSAFESCSKLTKIHIPASVTALGNSVFAYCASLEQMTVSSQNAYYHSQGNCIIRTADKVLVSGCQNSIIPQDGSVTVLDGYCFAGCSGLKSIVVPDQVTRIGAYAFYGCYNVEFMQLPFIGSSKDTDMWLGYIFGGFASQNDLMVPSSLKRVVITGGTIVGSSAFSGCKRLQQIVLPESITTIGYSAFEGCSELQQVVVPGELQSIQSSNIFTGAPYAKLCISAGKENTKSLVQSNNIPYQVGGLVRFVDEDGHAIDHIWYSLGSQIIPLEIPGYTWNPIPGICTGNQTIQAVAPPRTVTEGWLTYEIYNGEATVKSCDDYAYGSVIIPAAIEGYPVTAIGKSAFYHCILKSVTLPASIRYIGEMAFYECRQLKEIYFHGSAPEFVTSSGYCYDHTEDPWGDLDFDFTKKHEFGPFEGVTATAYCSGSASGWDAVTSQTMTGTGCGYTSSKGSITLKQVNTTLTGTVNAHGKGDLSLVLTSKTSYPVNLTVDQDNYCIVGLLPGNYTLTVSQNGAVTRSYTLYLQEEENTLELKLHQPGDINGDGRYNLGDMARMYAHVKSTKLLTDYALSCADFNGDGKITVGDTAKVYALIQGK